MRNCPACGQPIDPETADCPCGGIVAGLTPVTQVVSPGATPMSTPAPSASHRYLPGTLLQGRYRIVGPLGRGGMGEVFSAEDLRLGQTVALKFLPPAMALDAAARERFYAEVRIGRQVSHPNVCRLYDLVEIDGQPCLAMEHVDGEDLSTLLRRFGRLPPDKAVDVARDVCAGLAAVHDKGVVHRDLKPANIMVDGRGRARLTDFGIAALAEDAAGEGGLVGTLAYIAPEQLEGAPASVQSDLYALGLVLYEAFTGKPVYAPRTVHELQDLQARTGPPSLGDTARDLPPGVERVLQQCLARDPALRPASALEVLSTLPGGDPLQAALAAGETPSPAMVAAAGEVGDVPAPVAWLGWLLVVAGLLLIAALSARSTLIGRVRPELAPPVLVQQAEQLLAQFGVARPPFRKAFFDLDTRVLQSRTLSQGSTAVAPETARPSPVRFVYRGALTPLVARERASILFIPAELGRVVGDQPPMDVPGQVRVILDARGRLVEFLAVPRLTFDGDAPAPAEFDWQPALRATGLDLATLRAAPPRLRAPVDSDRKQAWLATYPGGASAVRVEAASFRGRPAWFTLRGPEPTDSALLQSSVSRIALWVSLLMGVAMLWIVVTLARRNLRQGRGDRRSAVRLAVALLIALMAALALRADHAASIQDEIVLVMNLMAQATFFAAAVALYYVALEPVARRRWPRLMISWTRLLAGRWRDPMVGRDVGLGLLVGIAMALVLHLAAAVPSGFGHAQVPPLAQVITTLTANRHVAHFMLLLAYVAVGFPVFALVGMFLAQTALRLRVLAHAAMFAFYALTFGAAIVLMPPWSLPVLLYTGLWYLALLRGGMLPAGVALYTAQLVMTLPLTLDSDLWYFERTVFGCGAIIAIAALAFRQALGGKPMIGAAWLGRDGG